MITISKFEFVKKFVNRTILRIISWTLLSQLIYLATYTYLISKVGNEAFAYLGQYISTLTIVSIFVSMRMEMQYQYQNDTKKEAIEGKIKRTSRATIVFGALIIFVAINSNMDFSALAILSGIVGGGINAWNNLSIQKAIANKHYNMLNYLRNGWIVQSSIISVIYYLMGGQEIMFIILSDIIARFIVVVYVRLKGIKEIEVTDTIFQNKENTIDIKTALYSVLTYNLPFILLPSIVGVEGAGILFFAFRMAMAPVGLFATVLNDYLKSIYSHKEGEDIIIKYRKDLKKIGLTILPLYLLGLMAVHVASAYDLVEQKTASVVIILLIPSYLRVLHASFGFIPYFTGQLKGNYNLFIRAFLYVILGLSCSLLTNDINSAAVIQSITYIIVAIDGILLNDRIVRRSKC